MWTPRASGKKNLYVDVKDSEGRVKRAGVTFEVKDRAIALASSLSASPTGSAVSGSQVKLTAGANGGAGNYTYKFLICDSKGNWYLLQDFSKESSIIWIPRKTSDKKLYVYVQDSAGRVARQEFTVTVITMVADVDTDENEIILVGATPDDASDERFSTGTSDTNAKDTLNEVFSAE